MNKEIGFPYILLYRLKKVEQSFLMSEGRGKRFFKMPSDQGPPWELKYLPPTDGVVFCQTKPNQEEV